MKRYEDIDVRERVVLKKECVIFRCDMCGKEAEHPDWHDPWEWGSVGVAGTTFETHYYIDGEFDKDEMDLCWDCARWIMNQIATGKIRRPENEDGFRF